MKAAFDKYRPAYTLRLASIRHQTLETPLCHFYKVPIPWTQGHPRDPTPTPRIPPGTPPGPGEGEGGKGAKGPGDPRDPKGRKGPKGAKGTQRRLRRLWGVGPMGPFGVIPKSFRMESHSEWKVITKGKPFRMKAVPKGSSQKAAPGVGILVIVCVRASCNSTCKMLQASTAQIHPEGSQKGYYRIIEVCRSL